MFPVGLVRPYGVASPIVSIKTGRVLGFLGPGQDTVYNQHRRMFPGVDMAGFAISLKLLRTKRPTMQYHATMEEETFLKSLDLK